MAQQNKINTYPQYSYAKAVAIWLFTCAVMVLIMALIGAVTRLTESGLSIVEWRPLIGALPPLHEDEWQRVFSLYQTTPEFIHKNFWMNLADFKTIFFWEWLHRLWGRVIGLVFFIPFLWFVFIKKTPKKLNIKLFIALLLGSLQAVAGWYMVASGLVDVPAVSHYRLAIHLCLALIIFSYLLWLGLDTYGFQSNVILQEKPIPLLVGLIFASVTIIWGAFVAGKDAGLIYNTFPQMGNSYIPDDIFNMKPFWINIIENPTTIQFLHRCFAIITVVYLLSLSFIHRKESPLYKILGAMALIQMSLGIATLLSQVHLHLASTHQVGAFLLTGILITLLQQSKRGV